jgi:hypothetical protein
MPPFPLSRSSSPPLTVATVVALHASCVVKAKPWLRRQRPQAGASGRRTCQYRCQNLYGCTSGEAGAFVLASKARRAHLPIPHRCQYLYFCTSETRAFVLVKHAQYRCTIVLVVKQALLCLLAKQGGRTCQYRTGVSICTFVLVKHELLGPARRTATGDASASSTTSSGSTPAAT